MRFISIYEDILSTTMAEFQKNFNINLQVIYNFFDKIVAILLDKISIAT